MSESNAMELKLAEVSGALASFVVAKVASTAALTDLVTAFNTNAPRSTMFAKLTAYVYAFNSITTQSNLMRTKYDEAKELAATMTTVLQNLNDGQVDEMKKNPAQYFCAGYLALVNSMLSFDRQKGLELAAMVHEDLYNDINNAWDDYDAGVTPVIPRTAAVYDSGNALDVVNKALKDATPADSPSTT